MSGASLGAAMAYVALIAGGAGSGIAAVAGGIIEGGCLLGVKHLKDQPGADPQKATRIKTGRYVLLALAAISALIVTSGACLAVACGIVVLAAYTNLSVVVFAIIFGSAVSATAAGTIYGHYKAFNWALN